MTWTNERIEAVEALLAAATPGPWTQHLVDETLVVSGLLEIASTNIDGTYDESFRRMAADAALIALSPALAARVIELEAEVERLREVLLLIEREVDDNGDAEEALVEIGCLITKALVDTGHARAALEPDA